MSTCWNSQKESLLMRCGQKGREISDNLNWSFNWGETEEKKKYWYMAYIYIYEHFELGPSDYKRSDYFGPEYDD